ncbi:MAG: hypothetical protein Q8Q65_00505 [bacterium]|nr:hypothetical protein [bacterium]
MRKKIEVRDEFTRIISNFKDEIIKVVKDKFSKSRNETASFKDEIMDRLERIEQELTVTVGYGDRIENHEERISVLEHPTVN